MSIDWYGEAILARARQGAMQGVVAGIAIVEARAVDLIMNGPKTGRIYTRRGVRHQASAPGEAPASDTGTLVNMRRIDLLTAELAARLVFSSQHAPHLEFGTRRMEPRPFARRALAETREEVEGTIVSHFNAALAG